MYSVFQVEVSPAIFLKRIYHFLDITTIRDNHESHENQEYWDSTMGQEYWDSTMASRFSLSAKPHPSIHRSQLEVPPLLPCLAELRPHKSSPSLVSGAPTAHPQSPKMLDLINHPFSGPFFVRVATRQDIYILLRGVSNYIAACAQGCPVS